MPNPNTKNQKLATYFKKTRNKRGYAIERMDEFTSQFIAEASIAGKSGECCLEIGAAYGFATIEALKRGAKMIANDIAQDHLNAIESNTPRELRSNLILLQGEFPKIFYLKDTHIRHILISRVSHYFTPDQMDEAIRACFDLLQPGGKVFLISESPYGAVVKKFIPVYGRRKADLSCRWPGFIDNLPEYMEEFSQDNPSQMLLLGEDELRAGFLRQGFLIEKCSFFSRQGVFPDELCYDGRESVGIIVVKPKKCGRNNSYNLITEKFGTIDT